MKCLVEQTLKEIEIIAVDDCSTDKSKMMLESWVKRFPEKIQYVSTDTNSGAGGARNLGITYASGKYVGFMDCDDIIEPVMYEKLYESTQQDDSDLVDCGYYDEANEKIVSAYDERLTGKLDDEKKNFLITGVGYMVTKIFNREFLIRNSLKVRENVIYEDLDFLVKALLAAKNISSVQETLYQYKNNETSSSKTGREQKKFDDMIELLGELNTFKEPSVSVSISYVIINCFVAAIGKCLLNQDNQDFKLVDNLRALKANVNHLAWNNWKENPFVVSLMPKENIDLVDWFLTLKI